MTVAEPIPFKMEEPQPLVREIPEGEAYPVEALGPIREAVEAVYDKTQAPIAIAAQSALSVASLAVQGFADVETLAGFAPASLFCLTVAASGERKSACDKLLMSGLREHEADAMQTYRIGLAAHQRDMRLWEAKESRLIKDASGTGGEAIEASTALDAMPQRPTAPVNPNRTATDPTFEGMVKLFANGNPSLGLFTDEGGSFFGGHAMNSDNKLKTCAGLSGLWDGSAINRTRAGDGATTLYGRRLASHMMAQPVAVRPLLADPIASGQGFLARFLICEPKSNIGFRTRIGSNSESDRALCRFKVKLQSILVSEPQMKEGTTNELEPRQLTLSDDARALLQNFYLATERAQQPNAELSSVTAYASKCAEQAARIAAVLTLWSNQGATTVTGLVMGDAITLSQFYLSEAKRLADAAVISEATEKAELLRKWLIESWGKTEFVPSDVQKLGPNSLRELKAVKPALKMLEESGWIVQLPDGAIVDGKSRKTAYRIVRAANA